MTIDSYQKDIFDFFRYLSKSYDDQIFEIKFVRSIEKRHIEDFLLYLESERGYGAKALNRKLAALKSFFKFCKEKKGFINDPTSLIERKKIAESKVDLLNAKEFQDIVNASETLKNRLILRFHLNGLRPSEIVNLKVSDINQEEKEIKVFREKTEEPRIFKIDSTTINLTSEYIKAYQMGIEHPGLFLNKKGDSLTVRAIQRVIQDSGNIAGISFEKVNNFVNFMRKNNEMGKISFDDLFSQATEVGSKSLYTIEDFTAETGYDQNTINSWRRNLFRKRHIIFQGPPGTGKTYIAERLAKWIVSDSSGFSDIVQFHPAYTYEDFIQGIHPEKTEEGVSFELKDGKFLDFCKKVIETSNEDPCILIIDEINRAHLSRVFGELMYLLEYRDKEITLAAGGSPFKIPENLFIIGTMNTADRSIALVDHALRRRFFFIRLRPNYDILKTRLENYGYAVDSLINVLKEINRTIDEQDYELGISFFLNDSNHLRENLQDIWEGEIETYLEQIFYDQPEKMEHFRWKELIKNELKDWVKE